MKGQPLHPRLYQDQCRIMIEDLVIGRRSFGKGLVQEQIAMNDGSVIRLTTQRYYTPSGRCIQKELWGRIKKTTHLEQYTRNKKMEYPDSLIYITKKGRTVYGGGGITPDLIIKRDSTTNFFQINTMISKGWLNEFCLKQSEKLKKNNIKSHNEIDKAVIYTQYKIFLTQKDNKFKLKLENTELKYFSNLLKATTCRNLWGNNIYYSILSTEDIFIQRAINEF